MSVDIAISLWQPWASLWLSDRKVHETRHWPCPRRGTIVVHAAKKMVKDIDGPLREILDDEFGGHWAMDLPTGALIGTVNLVASHCIDVDPAIIAAHADDIECGDWSEGRYAWRRDRFEVFRHPIPCIGRQGFFHVEYTR